MVRGVLVNDEVQYIYFISIPFADYCFSSWLAYLFTGVNVFYQLWLFLFTDYRACIFRYPGLHASFYGIMQLVPTYLYNRPCAQRLPTSYES